MAKKVLYKCKECGHEWKTKPPLFTSLHFCEKQGCKGTAYPQEDVDPSGIEKAD